MNKIQSKQEEKLKIEQEERKKVAEQKIQEKLKIEQEEKEKAQAQAQAQFIQNFSKEIQKFLKNKTEFKDCNFALNEEKNQLRVGDKQLQFAIENTGIRCLGKVFKSFAELIQNSEMQEIIKNESMMTRREAFLIIKESELENPSVLKQWIVENNDDWVAHAVWTQDSVKKIFEAGKLSPAEEVLRNSKEVEYEQGNIYGQRGTTSLPTLDEEEIEKIKKLYKEITSDPNLDIHIEEGTEWDGRKTFKFQLSGFTKYSNFLSILSEIAKKKSTHERNIYLAFEKTLPLEERFDFVLSKKYEMIKAAYKTKTQFENIPQNHIEKTEKDIYSIFNTLRKRIIPLTKVNPEIRTLKNQVAWSYGKVAILRGKTQEIIGIDAGEKALLAPWQNKGEFFSLELKQEDTLIMGPKKQLDKIPNTQKEGVKLVAFEEMTRAELDFFFVPQKLRPITSYG